MDNSERSGMHRKVERYLKQMQLAFDSEKLFHPYRVDIYLPEWHLVVEVDGPAHMQKADAKRDAVLREEHGLNVLHISHKHLGRERVQKAVRTFIEQNAHDVEERSAKWRRPTTL